MSTSYSNTLKVHNGFTEALTSVWVLHTSGSNYPYGQHLDFSNSPVAIGSDLVMTPPDANLVTTTGVPDNWSITWCDADGRLWGTPQNFTANVPHMDGPIEIIIGAINLKGIGYGNVTIIMPDGTSANPVLASRL
jgi:hypothetical protein